jgi:hypothetical protein
VRKKRGVGKVFIHLPPIPGHREADAELLIISIAETDLGATIAETRHLFQ